MYKLFSKNKGSTGSKTAVCHLTNAIDESTQCCSEGASTVAQLMEREQHLNEALDYLREQEYNSDCVNERDTYAVLHATKMSELTHSRQYAELLKKYSEISLDFLSKRRPLSKKEKEAKLPLPFVPVFSCHQRRTSVDSLPLLFEKAKFGVGYRDESELKKGIIKVANLSTKSCDILDAAGIRVFSKVLIKSKTITDTYRHPKADTSRYINHNKYVTLEHEFLGIIPEDTRKKINNAVESKDFDDIYLIKECTEWNVSPITQDPLIIGVKGKKAYIIDHFDCTDIESYVKKEFSL